MEKRTHLHRIFCLPETLIAVNIAVTNLACEYLSSRTSARYIVAVLLLFGWNVLQHTFTDTSTLCVHRCALGTHWGNPSPFTDLFSLCRDVHESSFKNPETSCNTPECVRLPPVPTKGTLHYGHVPHSTPPARVAILSSTIANGSIKHSIALHSGTPATWYIMLRYQRNRFHSRHA